MHDPTEGGLATGLWELAQASGRRLVVDLPSVPIFPETAAFCQALDLNPLGLIASGALLVAAAPSDSVRMVDALTREGIGGTIIGRAFEGPVGVQIRSDDGLEQLPVFEQDELARMFAEQV
jgi:hydrogenase maturation factor